MSDAGPISIKVRYRASVLFGVMLAALALLLSVITLHGASVTAAASAGPISEATVELLDANEDHISFVLKTPTFSVSHSDAIVDVPGLEQRTSTPDRPTLPYFSTYVVIPPDSQPRLKIIDTQPATTRTGISLPTVSPEVVSTQPLLGHISPELLPDQAREAGANSAEPKITPDIAVADRLPSSSADGLFPRNMVEVSEPMMLRDVRLVRVTIYPVQYDAAQGLLQVTPRVELEIDFLNDGAVGPVHLADSVGDQHLRSIAGSVLNPEQLQVFRGLPAPTTDANVNLPLGVKLFKIAVAEDGIHKLTYEALKTAGMAVDEIDPSTLQMMYRGQSVATDFSGDGDHIFEAGESLRFFGGKFEGSRLERQFISQNIYWLWAGGVASPVQSVASVAGQPVTTYLASLTKEPETIYFPGFTDYWPENEPDAWYWDWWTVNRTPVTRTYTVTLPGPASAGPPAQFTAEFSSRDSHISDQMHNVVVSMNGQPNVGSRSWWGELNFNVSATIPLTAVLDGQNHFDVQGKTVGSFAYFALNRFTVAYQRRLEAVDDQLIFTNQSVGMQEYRVQGYSQSQKVQYLAWNITDPFSPTAILTTSIGISGSGPYTVSFGLDSPADAKFILTTEDNVLSPAAISLYVAQQLDPPAGAQWVAVAHKNFMAETQRLASHRALATFGGLSTHVVDVEEIINQYGHGLPIPAAIQAYLAHAMSSWPVKPSYVTLVGDTTLDPRHLKADWTDQQYVPTDLVFVDRYNGQIPSDLTFALVSGSDIVPDLSVGRLSVETLDELKLLIDKIIRYDQNQLLSFGWMQNMVFVADAYDPSAGDFCHENQDMADQLPPSMNNVFLCLDDYSNGGTPDASALRTDLKAWLENTGVSMLAYRGHGAIDNWGGDPVIFNLADAAALDNRQPFVAISGDCLDGHFAYPPYEGLGERLVNSWAPADDIYGAAAHWGSSGLGVSSDHSDMLNGFYDGLFFAGASATGDAATHAKLVYNLDPGNDPALMYSFNLQGDPAMQVLRPNIELQAAWDSIVASPGQQATLTLTVRNYGVYPAQVALVGDDMADLSISMIASSVPYSVSAVGNSTTITLQFGAEAKENGFPRNGQATISVTYNVAPGANLGRRVAGFEARATGDDAWPGNEIIAKDLFVLNRATWLPTMTR